MIDTIQKKNKKYQILKRKFVKKTFRAREFCQISVHTSKEEFQDNLESFKKDPTVQLAGVLLKDLCGSTAWITNAHVKYLVSIIRFLEEKEDFVNHRQHKKIIQRIINDVKIDDKEISSEDIFQAIYRDLLKSHKDPDYKTPLRCLPIDATVVLVSGVFNEIFKTAAFERGVDKIAKHYDFKYFVANVEGTKGVKYNAKLLAKQLHEYNREFPKEKLWIIGYSKGGIDILHFLKNNNEFADKFVLGISMIATPILGSNRTDHKILKFSKEVFKKIKKKRKNMRDLFAIRLQDTLSASYQRPWFQKNHKLLPSKPFYTSLGFRAFWYESHFSMVLTKIFFLSKNMNDGVIDTSQAKFPDFFKAFNLGVINGHHLVGYRTSSFSQETLLKAHIIFLKYMKKI